MSKRLKSAHELKVDENENENSRLDISTRSTISTPRTIIDQTNITLSDKIEEVVSNYLNNPDADITAGIRNRKYNDDVDKILVNEFNNLNISTRTNIQEEVHGVHCMAIEETPELLVEKLKELEMELQNDDCIHPFEKRAYTLSLKIQLQEQQQQQQQQQRCCQQDQQQRQDDNDNDEQQHQQDQLDHDQSNSNNNKFCCYVNSDEFRLMYLRSELFDVKKAADRIVKALDFLLEFWGEYALKRKIRLSDFTKKEMRIMRKGYVQLLPSRDRGDRRIIVCFFGFGNSSQDDFDIEILRKIFMYFCFVCGDQDIENQRKGIVFIIWAEKYAKPRFAPQRQLSLPVRLVSIHFCARETLFLKLMQSMLVARMNKESRTRFLPHLAECIEVRYALQGFGIPVNDLPVTLTGTIKTENIKRFINLRLYIEKEKKSTMHNNNKNNSNILSSSLSSSTIIDCPYLSDLLFKKGRTQTEHHSGNIEFRRIVYSIYQQYLQQQQQQQQNHKHGQPSSILSLDMNILISDIINEIKKENVRVLVWNNKKSWWNILVDEEDYRKCIYNSAYHSLKKSNTAAQNITATAAKANKRKRSDSNNIFINLDGYSKNNNNNNNNDNESCFDLPCISLDGTTSTNYVYHPTTS